MPGTTLSKAGRVLKTLVALSATLLIFGVGNAISAPDQDEKGDRIARTSVHRAHKVKASQLAGPVVMVGEARTVSENPEWAESTGYDAVELACPEGRVAISGGFEAPDSAGVVLNGSHPGSTPSRWVVEVTYWSDGAPAQWIPNVTCA